MRGFRAGSRRIRLMMVAITLSLLACDTSDDPTDPGGGPDPFPGDGPYLAEFVLILPETNFINDTPPDWSPDGSRIVFSAKLASSIWTMPLSPGDGPLLITDPSVTDWLGGSYTPGYLGDGRICYYQGWTDTDRAMHVMAADTNQVAADPPPTVLRRFRGTAVGLSDYQASSPHLLSLSQDGLRAVGLWRDIYTLDWSDDDLLPVSRRPEILEDAVAFRISRDGSRIAFETAGGNIAWMDFNGDTAEVIGPGHYPSWRGDGQAIGYVSADGTSYRIHEPDRRATVSYRTAGGDLRHACLSWDGTSVAFLNGDGEHLILGYGRLVEGGQSGAALTHPAAD